MSLGDHVTSWTQLEASGVLFTFPLKTPLPKTLAILNIPMRPKFRDASVPTFLTAKVRETLLNATQEAEAQKTEESLSSAVALLVVLILLFCLVSVSLATSFFHKWKLRSKRLQKAHEEYQKDYENSGHRITSRLV